MTLYSIIYTASDGSLTYEGPHVTLADAQNAFAWFQSMPGNTQVQMISWDTTIVQTAP